MENDTQGDQRAESLADKTGEGAGGTPGSASESQQTDETQSGPESLEPEPDEESEGNPLPRSQPAELPDLDPETRAAVTPLPATAVNPGESYNDADAGFPVSEEDDEDEG